MSTTGINSTHHASRRIVVPKPLRAVAVLDSAIVLGEAGASKTDGVF